MSNHYNSAPTFTLFPNLPIEIRRMIWRLTLPGPRVVFVEPRKLKGGKCSRVWSDCENDEEGNEAFFDLEVSGEIDVRGRWSAYDFSGEKNRIQMREEEIYPNFEVLQDPAYEVATVVHKPGPQQLWGMKSTRLAPIVTLFICRESHQVAIDEKYTQAFGSIGCIPTIWFSYKHDILYMEPDSDPWPAPMNFDDNSHLVRKLAIGHSKGRNAWGSYWGRPRLYDAEMLAWFGNITEFIFVASPGFQDVLFDDCTLMDSVDEDSDNRQNQLYNEEYCVYKERAAKDSIEEARHQHKEYLADSIRNLEAQRARLRVSMREGLENGTWSHPNMNPNFATPKFRIQVLVPMEMEIAFEQAKARYEKEKNALRMNLTITSHGKKPMSFLANAKTSLADVWESFRAARDMSSPDLDARLSCVAVGGFGGLSPRASYILFELDGVVEGGAIEVVLV